MRIDDRITCADVEKLIDEAYDLVVDDKATAKRARVLVTKLQAAASIMSTKAKRTGMTGFSDRARIAMDAIPRLERATKKVCTLARVSDRVISSHTACRSWDELVGKCATGWAPTMRRRVAVEHRIGTALEAAGFTVFWK